MVGALTAENEAMYGRILAKYVDDPKNFFSVSSDFCHWGSRYVPQIQSFLFWSCTFSFVISCSSLSMYQIYMNNTSAVAHDCSCKSSHILIFIYRFEYMYYDRKHGAIYKSIEALDWMGMDIIERGDPDAFEQYLLEYDNTICGRNPISVYLHVSISVFFLPQWEYWKRSSNITFCPVR